MRAPAVPQELDDRQHDCETDAWDRAEDGDACETKDGQPELPALNPIEPLKSRDLEKSDRRGNDNGGQRRIGQMLQETGRDEQQEGHGDGADDAGQLRACSRRFRDGRAGRTTADRKSLEESCGEICGAKTDHFLIGIDWVAKPCGVCAREDASRQRP